MKLVAKLIRKLFPKEAKMYRNFSCLARGNGQWRSIKEQKAVDVHGKPIPWYTYPAIEYLRSFSFVECDVFEFGSGNSSLFWAGRARNLTSVESNEDWFKYVRNIALDNQVVIYHGLENGYVDSLKEQGKLFHVIIIDGEWRKRCIHEAVNYLNEGGMIVLDNSERPIEMEGSKYLREQGFFQIDFSGFGPINDYCWTTSIFMRIPTRLQHDFSGPKPIGGLSHADE